jgi:hypothetical protein
MFCRRHLVKGRYPSLADGERTSPGPNVFCSRFRRQTKTLLRFGLASWQKHETLILAGVFRHFRPKHRSGIALSSSVNLLTVKAEIEISALTSLLQSNSNQFRFGRACVGLKKVFEAIRRASGDDFSPKRTAVCRIRRALEEEKHSAQPTSARRITSTRLWRPLLPASSSLRQSRPCWHLP